MDAMWEAEFLFALRNRTGKYFVGRDVIGDQSERIAKIRYGRVALPQTPSGRLAKALVVAGEREIAMRTRRADLGGRIKRPRPVLHLDPMTVPLYALGPRDVVLCHDLGPITHPELFNAGVKPLYEACYQRIAKCQPTMVFVSQTSRDEYVRAYGPLPRMRVVYNNLRVELASAAPEPVAGINPRFLLTVGSIGRRKNQEAAIKAFAAAKLHEKGWSYVMCGVREPGSERVIALADQTPGVKVLSYVSDGALVWLYREAGGFVLVSLLEGFGVPVAEAIAAGLVPLVTKDSVLEEVAGEGALSADPHDPADIAAAMTRLAGFDAAEIERRTRVLKGALDRFTEDKFHKGWSEALDPASAA